MDKGKQGKIIVTIPVLVFLLMLSTVMVAHSQDAGLWTSLRLRTGIDEHLSIQAQAGHRLSDNLTLRDESFADLGLVFSIHEISAFFIYRLSSLNRSTDANTGVHRLSWEINYRQQYRSLSLELRTRLQSRYIEPVISESLIIPVTHLRNRIKSGLDINGLALSPSVSYELFYRLNNSMERDFEQQRIRLGIDYDLTGQMALQFYFLYLERMNVANPSENYIIGMGYSVYI